MKLITNENHSQQQKQYPFLKDYIYKLFIEWNEGEFMALQTKDSQFCLDNTKDQRQLHIEKLAEENSPQLLQDI